MEVERIWILMMGCWIARFLKWVLRVSDKKVMKGVPGVIMFVCQVGVGVVG